MNYFFDVVLGHPPQSEDAVTVGHIADVFRISADQAHVVKQAISEFRESGSHQRIVHKSGGRKRLLKDDPVWTDIYVDTMKTGCGSVLASEHTNILRGRFGYKPLHKSTYSRAAVTDREAKVHATKTTKSGSRDPESKWSVARYLFAMQLCHQLQGTAEFCRCYEMRSFSVYQVLWVRCHPLQSQHFSQRLPDTGCTDSLTWISNEVLSSHTNR